jgi:hypothetical protein
LSEVCPENNGSRNFEINGDQALIDISEFLIDLTTAEKTQILNELKKSLKKYTDEPELTVFGEELKGLETKREIKPVHFTKSFIFDDIKVISERVYIFVYHYAVTLALSLDPSHSINDCARYGFLNSLSLLDLHYSIKSLYDDINSETQELSKIEKSLLPRGLLNHRRKVVELESMAKKYENGLQEALNISNSLHQGLNEPYDANFQKAPNYRGKILSVLANMKSLPRSIFDSAGLLEHMELGGLKGIEKDVEPLLTKINIIEAKLDQKSLYLLLGLLFVIIVVPIAADYASTMQFNVSLLADLLEIMTFTLALLILIIRGWPIRKSS